MTSPGRQRTVCSRLEEFPDAEGMAGRPEAMSAV